MLGLCFQTALNYGFIIMERERKKKKDKERERFHDDAQYYSFVLVCLQNLGQKVPPAVLLVHRYYYRTGKLQGRFISCPIFFMIKTRGWITRRRYQKLVA
jgi:hypothetical protein